MRTRSDLSFLSLSHTSTSIVVLQPSSAPLHCPPCSRGTYICQFLCFEVCTAPAFPFADLSSLLPAVSLGPSEGQLSYGLPQQSPPPPDVLLSPSDTVLSQLCPPDL